MKLILIITLVVCASLVPGEATSRAYENLLGGRSILRKCGVEGSYCISDLNCCLEYRCSEQRTCQLRESERASAGEVGAPCVTDVDCHAGLCCQGSLYERTCTGYCPSTADTEVIPTGTYHGRQFWNQWTRNRRMDHHNWI